MSLFDSRIDERPPTFARGPLFSPVPHTRVILIWPAANGVAEFLQGGVVIEYSHATAEGPDDWQYFWRGTGEGGGHTWTAEYRWNGMDHATGVCNMFAQIESSTGGGVAYYGTPVTLPNLQLSIVIPKLVEVPADRFGAGVQRFSIPEWSDVVSRWPDAVEFPLPP